VLGSLKIEICCTIITATNIYKHLKKMKKISILSLIAFLVLFGSCSSTDIKNLKDGLKTGSEIARDSRRLVNDGKQLMSSLKMTKKEFNNTVAVFKSGSSATKRSSIPRGKESKFEIKKGKTQNLEWNAVAHFDDQLFPSVIVSMATYKEPIVGAYENCIMSSALGFRFNNGTKSYLPMKYEIECVEKKYFEKTSGDFIYQRAGQEEYFMPNIPWNFEALTKQVTNKPVKIYFRLFDDEGNKSENIVTVTMRSIDDCLLNYNHFDMKFLFAAYIQEQHPEIDKILREALNTKMANQWVGYQLGEKEVDKQISAIWRVLHERGFVYSSITDNAGDKGGVFSQTVRTFDTSIKTSQANCVDGTIVFASILRRIGIYPTLVSVYGHCFLGYNAWTKEDKDGNTVKGPMKYLETTMLGNIGKTSRDEVQCTKEKRIRKAVLFSTTFWK
jgi:hypothetical protein